MIKPMGLLDSNLNVSDTWTVDSKGNVNTHNANINTFTNAEAMPTTQANNAWEVPNNPNEQALMSYISQQNGINMPSYEQPLLLLPPPQKSPPLLS